MRRLLLVATLLLAGCGNGGSDRELTVFAASSLSAALTAEAEVFAEQHPDVRVRFSFAGSQSLVAQLAQGAPADVLATADAASMEASGVKGARVFAQNGLAVVTAPGNPLHLTSLADLTRVRVVLAGPTVPVGRAAAKALAAAGVRVQPVSQEQDVKGVVTKVRLGEADAGIAYGTDLQAAKGAVGGFRLPGVSNSLPVAAVTPGDDAKAFVALLLSDRGQQVLRSYGFLPPP